MEIQYLLYHNRDMHPRWCTPFLDYLCDGIRILLRIMLFIFFLITSRMCTRITHAAFMLFFLIFWVYYLLVPSGVQPNASILLFPLLVLQLAMLSLGCGIIISACTTKYRDLAMLVGFGVQLWMYGTPVAYDISIIPEKWMNLYMCNPVTPVVMTMRYAFLGEGSFDLTYYLIGWATTLLLLFFGVVLFSRVEKTFMDTV